MSLARLYGTMNKQHILIVDDEKDTRDFMARALSADYHVTTAFDAEMAIRKLEEDPSIVLMLSDIRMPGVDGMQLLQAAKKLRPKLICILLTAFGTVDQAVAAMKYGAEDFLMKPIDLDQLDLRITKALNDIKHLYECDGYCIDIIDNYQPWDRMFETGLVVELNKK